MAIGRAIVRDPKVFLMDEPLSNLDAKLRNQMRAEIIKLRERINTTFIYVTHDQTEAMTLGDRIVIMKDGFIQQIGTPQEVFNHPHNLFVAGFIGTPQMNFFDAKLLKENGKYVVNLAGVKVELSPEKQAALNAQKVQPQDITLGVRPEHILLSNSGVPAKVDVSEMMGSAVHLHSTMADGKDVVIVVQTMDMTGHRFPVSPWAQPSVSPSTATLAHVFSKETGNNLKDVKFTNSCVFAFDISFHAPGIPRGALFFVFSPWRGGKRKYPGKKALSLCLRDIPAMTSEGG